VKPVPPPATPPKTKEMKPLRALDEFKTMFPDHVVPFYWQFTWHGAAGTPYDGGTFYVLVKFPPDFPFKPPALSFHTPIYHPRVHLPTGQWFSPLCMSIFPSSSSTTPPFMIL
jgi:ubiquitin-protein ligase